MQDLKVEYYQIEMNESDKPNMHLCALLDFGNSIECPRESRVH